MTPSDPLIIWFTLVSRVDISWKFIWLNHLTFYMGVTMMIWQGKRTILKSRKIWQLPFEYESKVSPGQFSSQWKRSHIVFSLKYFFIQSIQTQVFESLTGFVELSQCSVLIGSIKPLLDFRKNKMRILYQDDFVDKTHTFSIYSSKK